MPVNIRPKGPGKTVCLTGGDGRDPNCRGGTELANRVRASAETAVEDQGDKENKEHTIIGVWGLWAPPPGRRFRTARVPRTPDLRQPASGKEPVSGIPGIVARYLSLRSHRILGTDGLSYLRALFSRSIRRRASGVTFDLHHRLPQ